MSNYQEKISSLIETQFPAFYRDEGPKFIAFVKAYYEWLEEDGNAGERSIRLRDYRDIDKTIDEFIVYFKNKYLVDFPFTTTADKRSIIKKAIDIYRAKGSESAVKLLFRLLFNEEASVYLPGDDVIKSSDGTYNVPVYIELEPNEKTAAFVGKEITGTISGAKAFVDRVDRRAYKGFYVDQVFISDVRGLFITGEIVTDDGDVDGKAKIIGSFTSLEITTPGRDFVVGEKLDVVSDRKGRLGEVVVSGTENDTGQVLFTIEDGGFGFVRRIRDINGSVIQEGSDVYIANNMFGFSNLTNSNTSITQFTALEQVVQYKATFTRVIPDLWSSGNPPVGTYVVGGNTGGSATNVAFGYVTSSANLSVTITSIDNAFNDGFTNGAITTLFSTNSTSGTTNATTLSTGTDVSTFGFVTGQNATHIGFHTITGDGFVGFFSNTGVQNNFIHGLTSNTYCKLTRKYLGQNANFEIGAITNEERVYVATDFVGGNNFADGVAGPGIPYLDIKISANTSNNDGYNSGVGLLSSVTVVNGGTGYINNASLTLTGGGAVSNAIIKVGTTDGSGVIQTVNVVSTGYGYDTRPVVSGGSPGTGANLQPVMLFGYGFPKLPYGGYNNIISECLTRETINVGTIAILSRVNPGEQYNISPFVYVIEPKIAGYNRKDLRINVQNITKSFVPGEFVQQNYYETGHRISFDTFVHGRYVSNVVVTAAGSGYTNNDPVFFSGGSGTGALGKVVTNATGNISSVSVTYGGRGYSSPTTATVVSAGSSATFTVNLANNEFIDDETIYQQQYRTTIDIGGWANGAPDVGSVIVAYNGGSPVANDGVVLLANSSKVIVGSVGNNYSAGTITNLVANGTIVGVSNATPTANVVATANIYGKVLSADISGASGNAVIQFQQNSFYANTLAPLRGVNAFNNGSTITGLSSAATANVSYLASEPNTVTSNTTLVVSKGQVIDFTINHSSNTGVLDLKRLSFNLAFACTTLVGSQSGAEASIVSIDVLPNSLPIGLNAEIIANTSAANNTLATTRIINSGLGYQQDEIVTLQPSGVDRFVATARVNLLNQGRGEGYFKNTQGFLNSDKYIHDSRYYQEYSYEIRSGLSLDKYATVLKQVLHVAGTKYFGNVVKIVGDILDVKNVSQTDIAITKFFYSNSTSISSSTITISNNTFGNSSFIFDEGDTCFYVRATSNTANIGLANNNVYYVAEPTNTGFKLKYANGSFVSVFANTTAPNQNETGHSLTRFN
jgi:hypothetical protein